MGDIRTYQIQIRGQVVENDIAPFCPPDCRIQPDGRGSSILTVMTDQAGLIGVIRNLHGLGFELLSITSN